MCCGGARIAVRASGDERWHWIARSDRFKAYRPP